MSIWLKRVSCWVEGKAKLVLSVPTDEYSSLLLSLQLAALPKVRLVKHDITPCAVLTCPMTVEVMETLQALPEWIKQVEMNNCS